MIQVGKLGKTNPHTHLATAGLHLPSLRFTCALSKKQVAWIICLLSLQWLALLLPVSDVVAVVGWLSFLIEAWLDPVTAPSLSKRRRSEQQHSGRLAFKWHLSLCSFLLNSFFRSPNKMDSDEIPLAVTFTRLMIGQTLSRKKSALRLQERNGWFVRN